MRHNSLVFDLLDWPLFLLPFCHFSNLASGLPFQIFSLLLSPHILVDITSLVVLNIMQSILI